LIFLLELQCKPFNPKSIENGSPYHGMEDTIQVCRGEKAWKGFYNSVNQCCFDMNVNTDTNKDTNVTPPLS